VNSLGSTNIRTSSREKAYAFIDADNVQKGFLGALKRRGLSESECDLFDPVHLFHLAQVKRYYLYSAVEIGKNPPEWIARFQSLPNFIFRGATLKTSGSTRKQEGVDVRLALEAYQYAVKRLMEECIISSCDGDLLPLVDALISEGISTTVCCFNNPEKGDVSSRLRDSSDNYVHIGDRLLTMCMRPEFRTKRTTIGNASSYLQKGQIEIVSEGNPPILSGVHP
jgi:uncharacterized LabA/DUF88 family protein